MIRPREDGSATVVATSLIGLLLIVGLALGAVNGIFVRHRSAQAAADLAAVAAAQEQARGGDACAAGRAVARANRARLSRCSVQGREVTVTVSVPGPPWPGLDVELDARARAGPEP